jgi:hypothetical protein
MRACMVVIAVSLLAGTACADPIVIGGSSLTSPPPFWQDSFWGITPTLDQAFAFHVIDGVAYELTQLEVAAYHYEGMAGNVATFSIYTDAAGQPGTPLTSILIDGISTTQGVLSAPPSSPITLLADTTYWLVGQTPIGQVNWNLGDMAFGPAAYRVNDGEWIINEYTNVSAFTLSGTPVPEPTSALLLATALATGAATRRGFRAGGASPR